jgi:hypothetical protein
MSSNTDLQHQQKLIDLRKIVEEAKSNKDESEGALKTLYNRMEKEFKCKTIEDLKKKRENFKQRMIVLKNKREAELALLEQEVQKYEESLDE